MKHIKNVIPKTAANRADTTSKTTKGKNDDVSRYFKFFFMLWAYGSSYIW